MEAFVTMSNDNGGSRCSFRYASPVLGPPSGHPTGYGGGGNSRGGCNNNKGHDNSNSHRHGPHGIPGAFHLQPTLAAEAVTHLAVKIEGPHQHHHQDRHQAFCDSQVRDVAGRWQGAGEGSSNVEAIKAKIVAHPQYPDLLDAYMGCQKIGAPPEVVAKLSSARREFESRQWSSVTLVEASSKDPELDQFMEAYYDVLLKYREELTRPLQEATEFIRRIESQLNSLCTNCPIRVFPSGSDADADDKCEGIGTLEDEQQVNSEGETDQLPENDLRTDRDLKNHLLRKYSGYLSSLKQELSKKKKKGKLPKEARQKLLSWWELHYKWPYPSESEKVALAEATGLDQKQINNWFINQRKRHWKPSEDMQIMVMDGLHPQTSALYMDGNCISDGPYRWDRDLGGRRPTK